MSGNNLNSFPSGLCNGQKGAALTETVMVLISVILVSLVVSVSVFGSSIFSADKGPDTFKIGPGAFSPITDLEKNGPEHPERAFSTVKGAISDLESNSTGNAGALSMSRDK